MRRDIKSLLGGGVLVLIGLFVTAYAQSHYDLGTLSRMGPGLFPMALGCILAGLGVLILISGFLRTGETPEIELRSLALITLAVVIFALVLERVGLGPAVVLMTIPAALADGRLGTAGTLLLALVLAAVAVLLFIVAFGMPIPLARWPF